MGHASVFDEDGSFIINKLTGETDALREKNGNYMLDMYVPPAAQRKHDLLSTVANWGARPMVGAVESSRAAKARARASIASSTS